MKLDNIRRLQACYWTAKNNPYVIECTTDEVDDENDLDNNNSYSKDTFCGILNSYYSYPKAMVHKYGPCRQWDQNTTLFLGLQSLYAPGGMWRERAIVGPKFDVYKCIVVSQKLYK